MRIRKKHDLDAIVAAELGLSKSEVADVTRAFLEKVREALVDMDEVHLSQFGRFRTVIEKAPKEPVELFKSRKKKSKQRLSLHRKVRVHFSKAQAFNRAVRTKHGPGAEKKP